MLTQLKIKNPPKLPEDIGISGEQVDRLATLVQQGQLERISQGLDANDQPMEPLTEKYRRRKLREGKQGVRDWKRQGRTLRALKVIEVGPDGFVVGFWDDAEARKRAHFRQMFDGAFGLSPQNAAAFDAELEDVFTELYTELLAA